MGLFVCTNFNNLPQIKIPELRLNRCAFSLATVLVPASTPAPFFAALYCTVSFTAHAPVPALYCIFHCTYACACARDYAIHSWGIFHI